MYSILIIQSHETHTHTHTHKKQTNKQKQINTCVCAHTLKCTYTLCLSVCIHQRIDQELIPSKPRLTNCYLVIYLGVVSGLEFMARLCCFKEMIFFPRIVASHFIKISIGISMLLHPGTACIQTLDISIY